MEARTEYRVLNQSQNRDKLEARRRSLTTRNLEELERELERLERELAPLLNFVRAMRGKKPMIWPKE